MAEHFEAKKYAYRQSKDGIIVSFVVHPDELPKGFAVSSLGTRYMVGVAEIGDDEQPVPELVQGSVPHTDSDTNGKREALDSVPDKQRKPFASLPYSQQSALRCQDTGFQIFMRAKHRAPLMLTGSGAIDADTIDLADLAANDVRHFCKATSRAQLDMVGYPQDAWKVLDAEYQSYVTTQKYGEAARR